MALDSATKRGGFISPYLPVPDGTVDQEARQAFLPIVFPTPIAVTPEVWAVQPDEASSWSGQADSANIWTNQPDASTVWS